MANLWIPPEFINLLSLPTEILEAVWDHLACADLKNLRLVCKSTAQAASPHLFHTITFYPHLESLDQLTELCKTTHIALHVQKLIYDCHLRFLLDTMLHRIDSAPQYKALDHQARQAINLRISRVIDQYIDHRNLNDQLELAFKLREIFLRLPNVQMVSVVERDVPLDFERMSRFYSRIFGNTLCQILRNVAEKPYYAEAGNEDSNMITILFSTTSLVKPLKNFELSSSLYGWMEDEKTFNRYSRCSRALEVLEELHLSFTDETLSLLLSNTCNLQALLKQARNLTRLKLEMGRIRQGVCFRTENGQIRYAGDRRTYGCPTFQGAQLSHLGGTSKNPEARLTWSTKIRTLELGGLKCSGDDLKKVLKHVSGSLDNLTLSDFILIPSLILVNQSPRGCLVQTIKWLQKSLKLRTMSFAGTITNFGMQHWVIYQGKNNHPSSLYRRVTNFVVNGGPCPLDFVAIPSGWHDLGKEQYGFEFRWRFGHGEYNGDDGWRMMYFENGVPLDVAGYHEDDTDREDGPMED
ncbi:hypothetical protein ES702_02399 [subsurface metagenome]